MYAGFIVLSVLEVLGQSFAVENISLEQRWADFKNEQGRTYARSEEPKRLKLFKNSVKIVDDHNKRYEAGSESYFMAINQFSDMTEKEFNKYTLTRRFTIEELSNSTAKTREISRVAAPASIDWRTRGVVTAVKNQGPCGSCWAFSATGSLEAQMKIQKGKGPTPLSDQQLVDCDTSNNACKGGWAYKAYDYIKKQGGIEAQNTYPAYSAKKENCRFNARNIVVQVSSGQKLLGTEAALEEACGNQGPIAVGIDVTDKFQRYGGGIFVDDSCSSNTVNHAGLVVGYDRKNNQDYWIVKNSWGAGWGEAGYIRMARKRNNMCAVGRFGIYPIVFWAK